MRHVLVIIPFVLTLTLSTTSAKVQEPTDPPGMKRYEGAEIIGYRAPKFEEYLLPLSAPTVLSPPAYGKSERLEGRVSRYTYVAPAGRSAAEFARNYANEFTRMGLDLLFEKRPGQRGWFGPTFDIDAREDGLGQILAYNEADERLLVGRSKGASPTHYVVFVTTYRDGIIPSRLVGRVAVDRALAHIIVVEPDVMEEKMVMVNADQIREALRSEGRVALYGIYFDTDKDAVKPESEAAMKEIAVLLSGTPSLKLHVVGHTDNQGTPEYNLDLSRRRAASVVRELTSKYGIAAGRLDAFGAGLYAPAGSNTTDEGRAKNRRVELVLW